MANYSSLITKAITGFDNVWSALSKKTGVLTANEIALNDLVDVSTYGTRVNKLVSLVKSDGSLFDGSTLHSIAYVASGETKTIASTEETPIVRGVESYTFNFNPSTAAYYTTGSTLTATLTATNITFSPDHANVTRLDKTAYYTVAIDDGLIGSVVINDGSVAMAEEVSVKSTVATSITSLGAESGDLTLTKLASETATADNSYYIDITTAAATSGKVTTTATANVTEGYVLDATLTKNAEWTADPETVTAGQTVRYAIPKGSVKVESADNSSASADIVATTNYDIWSTDATDIVLDAAVSNVTLKGTFTEGYVKAGDKIDAGKIEVPGAKKYIKVGSVPDQTVTLTNTEITESVVGGAAILGDGGVSIKVEVGTTADKTFTPGFINTAGTVTVAGEKTINIKKAKFTTGAAITGYTPSGNTQILGGSDYKITITPTLTPSKAFTEAGLILSANDISVTDDTQIANKSYELGFAAGTISLNDIGFAMEETVVNNDGINDTISFGSLFLDAGDNGTLPDDLKDNDRDYFKVKISTGYSSTAGFIEGGSSTKSLTKFVPKAVIEWVKDEKTNEEYIQVAKAGYLPSGTLTEITEVAPSAAVVTLKAQSTGMAVAYTPEADKEYETITISKNGVDAGYISDSKGSLTNNVLYIEKGSVTGKATATVTGTGVSKNAETGKYDVALKSVISNNITFKAGYISENKISTPDEQTGTYTLNKATFARGTHTTEVKTVGSNLLGSDINGSYKTSKYYVTPSITNCSATFTVGTEGYIAAGDNADLAFSFEGGHNVSNTDSVYYIKPGTAAGYTVTSPSDTLTATGIGTDGKITLTNTGAYVLDFGGNVNTSLTLEEGYYGSTEKTVTGTLAVTKQITVAHGSITGSVEGSNAITATDASNAITLYTEKQATDDAANATYSKISANATVTSKTTVTEGYIKSSDVTEGGITASASAYVKLFTSENSTTADAQGKTNWKVTVGQTSDALPTTAPTENESIVLETEARYSMKNTTVLLSDNAMGKSVVAELLKLEARLAGEGAKS